MRPSLSAIMFWGGELFIPFDAPQRIKHLEGICDNYKEHMPHGNTDKRKPTNGFPSLTNLDTGQGEQLYIAKLFRSPVVHYRGLGASYTFTMTLTWEPVTQEDPRREPAYRALRTQNASKVILHAVEERMYGPNGMLKNHDEDVLVSTMVLQTTDQPQGFEDREFEFVPRITDGVILPPEVLGSNLTIIL